MKSKIIEHKGEKVLMTAGLYFYNGIMFRTLNKAKKAIEKAHQLQKLGLN